MSSKTADEIKEERLRRFVDALEHGRVQIDFEEVGEEDWHAKYLADSAAELAKIPVPKPETD